MYLLKQLEQNSIMTSSDIVAVCSLFVAVLAFLTTMWQGWLSHRHNRLSVRPLLAWHIGRRATSEGTAIIFAIKNLGLGPAVIKDRYFTKAGERYTAPDGSICEASAVITSVLANRVKHQVRASGLPGCGTAIPSQGEIIVGEIFFPGAAPEQLANFEQLGENVNFHVQYECLYGNAFAFDTLGKQRRSP